MEKIVVFGNSGSGKSTYASDQSERLNCAHMDLDTVAWAENTEAPTRRDLAQSRENILQFIHSHNSWIIEGCYADLLAIAIPQATEIVFLNPGSKVCVENAKNRPWEPHKYSTPEAQEANLEMLIAWIREYEQRSDEFSYQAHRRLFDDYAGSKREFLSNARECTALNKC